MSDDDLVDFCKVQYPRLVGMLGLYCGDGATAEELAQEALARVWKHWSKVRRMDRPEAWAARAGINLARSHLRRRLAERRALTRLGPRDVAHVDPDAPDVLTLRSAIAALPHRQKTALVLRYYLGLSFAEIAGWMDAPESTVKSHVRRAIKALRTAPEYVTLEEGADASRP